MNARGIEGTTVTIDIPAWQRVCRWAAVFPGAIIAAVAAQLIVKAVNSLMLSWWMAGFMGGLGRIGIEGISHVAAGWTLVFAAAYIAPAHKRYSGLLTAAAGFVLAGVLLSAAALTHNGWAAYGAVAFAIGVALAAIDVGGLNPAYPDGVLGR